MPFSKTLGAYPYHLFVAVEQVLTSRIPVRVSLSNLKAAQRLRMQVYGLKGALEKSESHPLHLEAPKLTTTLDGTTLTINHVDNLVPEGLWKGLESEAKP